MIIYLIGSMRNPRIPEIGNLLRAEGHETFEEWYAPGSQADEEWQKYEKQRGRSYKEALAGYHAKHVFAFDLYHLDRCDMGVLVLPAGKSAHMELGYLRGSKKPTIALFDGEPERYDIMYQFATAICFSIDELLMELQVMQQRRGMVTAPWGSDR